MIPTAGAGGRALPPFADAVVFFDLGGTLVEVDERLRPEHGELLVELGRRTRRIVLMTGQPFDDPQVQQVLRLFQGEEAPPFVGYTTRGGLRLVQRQSRLERDLDYLERSALPAELVPGALREIERALEDLGLRALCPVLVLDRVAVRVNLRPAERPAFADSLVSRFARSGHLGLRVVIDGRTSIFVMRDGVGKRQAVRFEISRDREPATWIYFGNEVAEGNDREVLGVPGLEVFALGSCGSVAEGARCRSIGEIPKHLYELIECFLRATSP